MLSDRDRAMLDFEAGWWRQRGSKENAIAAQFDLTPVRYYQLLNRLLDDTAAVAYAPAVVGRLRRIRGGGPERRHEAESGDLAG
ncbi:MULTISPECIES: DUF3263 domain-containing protein [Tsukamurella]|uniref:DUF3263 domain-containing protein n=2 Tax=Tsukamurella TaxID=2060 RepID=A0A5C5S7D2_9ACTN|nr:MULTISPECIES: DUF3263 domain-containing protein [Tsukamurella]NMD55232.1 DUF3263 domain-containing protein [Tsukamurella columbiensis]TWS30251.1 DUF3263 domain-containing protein [Tsukamurella conjunctivitidis]